MANFEEMCINSMLAARLHYPGDNEKMSVEMKMENLFNNSVGNSTNRVEGLPQKNMYTSVNNNKNIGIRGDKQNVYSFSSQLLDELRDEFSLSSVVNERDESVTNAAIPHSEPSVTKDVDSYFEDNFTNLLSEEFKGDLSNKKNKSNIVKNCQRNSEACNNSVQNNLNQSLVKDDFYNGSLFDSSSDIFQSFAHSNSPSDYFTTNAKDGNTDEFVNNSGSNNCNINTYESIESDQSHELENSFDEIHREIDISQNKLCVQSDNEINSKTVNSVLNESNESVPVHILNTEKSTNNHFSDFNKRHINRKINNINSKEDLSPDDTHSEKNVHVVREVEGAASRDGIESVEVKSEPYSDFGDEEMRALVWPPEFMENVKMTMAGQDDLNFDGDNENGRNFDQNDVDEDDEDSRLSPRSMMPWLCLHCPTYCDNKDQYMEHLKLHDESGRSPTAVDAAATIGKIHPSSSSSVNKVLRCEVCGKVFPTINSLQEHMLVHTNLKPHVCVKCNKSFRYAASFRAHVKSHKTRQLCKCNICGIIVSGNEQYNQHLKERHPGIDADDFSNARDVDDDTMSEDDDNYYRDDDNDDDNKSSAMKSSSNRYFWGGRSSTYLMERYRSQNNLIGGRYNKRPVKRHLCLSINDDDSDVRDDDKDEDYIYDETEEQYDDIEEEYQNYGRRRKRTRYDSDEDYRLPSEEVRGKMKGKKMDRGLDENNGQDGEPPRKRPGRPRGSKNKKAEESQGIDNSRHQNAENIAANNKHITTMSNGNDGKSFNENSINLNNLSFDYTNNDNKHSGQNMEINFDKSRSNGEFSNSGNSSYDKYFKKMLKRKSKLQRFISKLKNKNIDELQEIKDRIERKKYTYEGTYGEENDAIIDKLCAIIDRRIDRYNTKQAKISEYRNNVNIDDYKFEDDDEDENYDVDDFFDNEKEKLTTTKSNNKRPAIKVYKYHKERVVYLPKVDIENVVCNNGIAGPNFNNKFNNKYFDGTYSGQNIYDSGSNFYNGAHDYDVVDRSEEIDEDHEKIVADELNKLIGGAREGLALCKKDDVVKEELDKIRNQINARNSNNKDVSCGIRKSVFSTDTSNDADNNTNYEDYNCFDVKKNGIVVHGDEELTRMELERIISTIDGGSCIINRNKNDIITSELNKASKLNKSVIIECKNNFASSENLFEILGSRESILDYKGTDVEKIVSRELKKVCYTWNYTLEKNLKDLWHNKDSHIIKKGVVLIKTHVDNKHVSADNASKLKAAAALDNNYKIRNGAWKNNLAHSETNLNENDPENVLYNVNAVHEDTEPGYIMKICDIWNEAIKLRHTSTRSNDTPVSDFQEIAHKRLNIIFKKLKNGVNVREPVLMGPLFWKNTLSEYGIENVNDFEKSYDMLLNKHFEDTLIRSNDHTMPVLFIQSDEMSNDNSSAGPVYMLQDNVGGLNNAVTGLTIIDTSNINLEDASLSNSTDFHLTGDNLIVVDCNASKSHNVTAVGGPIQMKDENNSQIMLLNAPSHPDSTLYTTELGTDTLIALDAATNQPVPDLDISTGSYLINISPTENNDVNYQYLKEAVLENTSIHNITGISTSNNQQEQLIPCGNDISNNIDEELSDFLNINYNTTNKEKEESIKNDLSNFHTDAVANINTTEKSQMKLFDNMDKSVIIPMDNNDNFTENSVITNNIEHLDNNNYEVIIGDTGIVITLGSDRVKDVESIIESVNQALTEANISLDEYEGNLDFTINEISTENQVLSMCDDHESSESLILANEINDRNNEKIEFNQTINGNLSTTSHIMETETNTSIVNIVNDANSNDKKNESIEFDQTLTTNLLTTSHIMETETDTSIVNAVNDVNSNDRNNEKIEFDQTLTTNLLTTSHIMKTETDTSVVNAVNDADSNDKNNEKIEFDQMLTQNLTNSHTMEIETDTSIVNDIDTNDRKNEKIEFDQTLTQNFLTTSNAMETEANTSIVNDVDSNDINNEKIEFDQTLTPNLLATSHISKTETDTSVVNAVNDADSNDRNNEKIKFDQTLIQNSLTTSHIMDNKTDPSVVNAVNDADSNDGNNEKIEFNQTLTQNLLTNACIMETETDTFIVNDADSNDRNNEKIEFDQTLTRNLLATSHISKTETDTSVVNAVNDADSNDRNNEKIKFDQTLIQNSLTTSHIMDNKTDPSVVNAVNDVDSNDGNNEKIEFDQTLIQNSLTTSHIMDNKTDPSVVNAVNDADLNDGNNEKIAFNQTLTQNLLTTTCIIGTETDTSIVNAVNDVDSNDRNNAKIEFDQTLTPNLLATYHISKTETDTSVVNAVNDADSNDRNNEKIEFDQTLTPNLLATSHISTDTSVVNAVNDADSNDRNNEKIEFDQTLTPNLLATSHISKTETDTSVVNTVNDADSNDRNNEKIEFDQTLIQNSLTTSHIMDNKTDPSVVNAVNDADSNDGNNEKIEFNQMLTQNLLTTSHTMETETDTPIVNPVNDADSNDRNNEKIEFNQTLTQNLLTNTCIMETETVTSIVNDADSNDRNNAKIEFDQTLTPNLLATSHISKTETDTSVVNAVNDADSNDRNNEKIKLN